MPRERLMQRNDGGPRVMAERAQFDAPGVAAKTPVTQLKDAI